MLIDLIFFFKTKQIYRSEKENLENFTISSKKTWSTDVLAFIHLCLCQFQFSAIYVICANLLVTFLRYFTI